MEGFEVSRQEDGQISVLQLKGYLDAHTAPDLESAFQKLVDEDKFKIVVNFKDLSYISSAGLGVFMGFIEDIRKNGGDIKLTNMTPKIFRIFDLLGFPTLYDIMDDVENAKEKFGQN
jgi:anti-sigma B factor antagonist